MDVDYFLAGILRTGTVDPATLALLTDDAVHRAACEHDVLPLFADRMAASAAVSPDLRARYRLEAQMAAAADLAAERALRSLLAALSQRGIDTLVIKGSHLAYTHYARPDLRARIDTDLLIARDAREAADDVLTRELRYEAGSKLSGELTATQQAYVMTTQGRVVHMVDLHWRLASPQVFAHALSFHEMLAESVPIPALAASARGPCDMHALIIACMHRVAHHHDEADRFKWLYDIHLLASRLTDAEWERFTTLATERGIAAVCREGLERTARWFETSIPARVRHDRRFVDAGQHEETAAFLRVRPRAREELDHIRALPRWRDRARLAREHLWPSASYMRRIYAPGSRLPLTVLYVWRIVRGAAAWVRPR